MNLVGRNRNTGYNVGGLGGLPFTSNLTEGYYGGPASIEIGNNSNAGGGGVFLFILGYEGCKVIKILLFSKKVS